MFTRDGLTKRTDKGVSRDRTPLSIRAATLQQHGEHILWVIKMPVTLRLKSESIAYYSLSVLRAC